MCVSVVIPTHNRIRWLRLALRSVLWQNGVDLEVIVVDDGSIDDTMGTVQGSGDVRIRVLRHERRVGSAASRNHGGDEATGEWLAFLDDDDLWAPDKLLRQVAAAEESRRDWVYTGSVNVDENLRVMSGVSPPPPDEVTASIFRRNTIPGGGSNVVMRRHLFERVGPFDVRLMSAEDWDLWIRLAEVGPPAWVPEPLMAKRIHPTNLSLDVRAIFASVRLIEQRRGVKADHGFLHRWVAESCLRTGRRAEALKHMGHAALRGQALPVSRDLIKIMRRRLNRPALRRHGERPSAVDPWIAQAQEWLRQLEQE
jgi:glycosyltransferase involved in cell wall biosynthesis